MAFLKDSDYRGRSFPFPKHDIDPSKKNEEWHCSYMKAIWSKYHNEDTINNESLRSRVSRLRKYAEGRQSPEIYKDMLVGGKQPNSQGVSERKGYTHLNFEDIFSPAPKYLSVILGMFEATEHSIVVSAEDEQSGTEKLNMKETLWFKAMEKPFLEMMDQSLGIQKPDEYIPQTRKELDLFDTMGGFKLRYETAMEKCLSHTFYLSNWKEIKRKMIYDFCTDNMAATMDVVDKYEGKVKLKYIDFSELIMEYSRDWNFSRSQWGAIPELWTIEELRTSGCTLSEEQLQELAYQNCGAYGNPLAGEWKSMVIKNTDGSYGYDSFRVNVLYGAWKSFSRKYVTEKTTGNGKKIKVQSKYGKEYNTDSKKTEKVDIRTVHNAYWIVGTDHVFNWGIMYDTPRQGKDVRLPFHVYRIPGKSIVEQMIPNLDSIEITYLKLQNFKATTAPPGLIIELGALENISLGGKKMPPLELIKVYQQNGTIFYRATPFGATTNNFNSGPPITPHNGGLGALLGEFINSFESDFNQIAEITGIARNATGTVDPAAQVGTSRMAVAATNNVLKPIYAGYIDIKESCAINTALRIQCLVKYDDATDSGYYPVIGKASMQALKDASSDPPAKWGIRIEALPTEEMRQELKAAAQAAMAGGKNGIPALNMSEFLMITEKLNSSGSYLHEIRAFISYKEYERDKQEREIQERNMQLNAQNAQETEAKKAQSEMAKIELEANTKIKVIQTEYDLKLRNDLQVIAAKTGADVQKMLVELEANKPQAPSLSGQQGMPPMGGQPPQQGMPQMPPQMQQ